jgi:hypothetical protein
MNKNGIANVMAIIVIYLFEMVGIDNSNATALIETCELVLENWTVC